MTDLTEVTLTQMNQLAADIAALRDKEKEAADAKALISKELETREDEAIELLVANGLASFKSSSGLLSLGYRLSARLPQGDNKVKLYDHLRQLGLFEEMASINSVTFNSWVKEQYELAHEKGEMSPQIPGVDPDEVKTLPRLSFRRTR